MLRLSLIVLLLQVPNFSKADTSIKGQVKNDANGQIINSMGFHPVGQARIIRSVIHLREEVNLQPLAKALKGITEALSEYKQNCKDFGKAKKNFLIVGRGHREQAKEVCAQRDMVVAQPFSKTLQKELNTLLNEKGSPFVAIDVAYDLATQSVVWPLTGQGLWESFAEDKSFDLADFTTKKSLIWSEVYRRYDQLFFYSSNKIWVKRTNHHDGLNHVSLKYVSLDLHTDFIVCMNRYVAINQSIYEGAQKNCREREKECFDDIDNIRNRLKNFVRNYVSTGKQFPAENKEAVLKKITARRTRRSLYMYGAIAINLYNYAKRVFRHYQGKREAAALASYAQRNSVIVYREGDRFFQPYISERDLKNAQQRLAAMERYMSPMINTLHQQLASWEEIGNNVMTNNHRL